MPRKPKPPPLVETPKGEAAPIRKWDVLVTRIVEQSATVVVMARTKDDAEELVNAKFEDHDANFINPIKWGDGELETTESVVIVTEHRTRVLGGKKVSKDSEEAE